MENQQASERKARVLPQVRYHPTIQAPAAAAAASTATRTRTTCKCRSGAASSRQTSAEEAHQGSPSDPGPVTAPTQGQKHQRANETLASVPPQVQRPEHIQNPTGAAAPTRTTDKVDQENQADEPVKKPSADPNLMDGGPPPRPEQVPPGLEVQMDQRLVEKVEVLTRGQRDNPAWFAWRKYRITASMAHNIAQCRFVNGESKTPPSSYLAAITGERGSIQTRAMSWGIEKEDEAIVQYQRLKSEALQRPISVLRCGLFIEAHHPWLAASPDGIVTDRESGEQLLCLEVKCPYKHKHRRVEDACRVDRAFCLEIQDEDGEQPEGSPRYRLKTSHSFFTQIQCQLAMTGLRHADLVIFTLEETAIVPVTFDPGLWEETVSKLEFFYREAVLPHLREKMQPSPKTKGRPARREV
ncbi:uncharacterized protein ACBR49_004163 isoform 2-T3 [Aulostomus maculatus]